jgi:L-iditol 2-dehydrogenase
MKALVKIAKGPGNLEIREIQKPVLKQDEILIEVKAAGICGTDLHHYQVGDQIHAPVVLGHEFSGDVVEIGSEVKGWRLGERIVSETHAHACYACSLCRMGNYHLCEERKGFGSSVNGAFTRYVAVPPRLLHRVPEAFSYAEASVLQPLADIVNATIRNADVIPGDTVVVFGPGPMGLLTAQMAKALGAAMVMMVGLDADKRRFEVAKEIGVDKILNASEGSVVQKVKEITGGRGADVVFEVSGSKVAFLEGLKLLRKKGQLTVIGVPTEPVLIDLEALQAAAQTIRTSVMSTWEDYERAIRIVESGRVKLKPLITDVLPLEEWQKGFDSSLRKSSCKVVLVP